MRGFGRRLFPRRRPHYLRILSLNKHNRLILNEIRTQHLSPSGLVLPNMQKETETVKSDHFRIRETITFARPAP
ncbi:hypothetical protein F01_420316 [Burkholderia cenocepacia]|nr:hypothetical protein F01_420316 [Burkholderia cenocepacia]